jgi:uncharacterized protein (DUF1697 family)
MKDLKKLLEGMGCKNILTYIQSGNVVFNIEDNKTRNLEEEISSKILKSHGFSPRIILLKKPEFESAIKSNPFKTNDGKALHFFFLESHPQNPEIEKLNSLKSGTEQFLLKESVFYLYAPDGIGRSQLAANVEKCLRVPVTARNWNTVSKLNSMINS